MSAVLFLIIASLTNYHKLSSQNNTNFLTYSSRGQKSKNLSGWNLKICSFLKDLGEILFPCLFWWLAAAWSQSAGPSFHLRSLQGVAGQTLLVLYRSDTWLGCCFPSTIFKDPCDYIGPTWMFWNNPISWLTTLIPSVTLILLCHVRSSQVSGIRT